MIKQEFVFFYVENIHDFDIYFLSFTLYDARRKMVIMCLLLSLKLD